MQLARMAHAATLTQALLLALVAMQASTSPGAAQSGSMEAADLLASRCEALEETRDGLLYMAGGPVTYLDNIALFSATSPLLPRPSHILSGSRPNRAMRNFWRALDSVLKMYDLQRSLSETNSSSDEILALQVVVQGVINDTCAWFHTQSISCDERELRKLSTMLTAHFNAFNAHKQVSNHVTSACGTRSFGNPRPWVQRKTQCAPEPVKEVVLTAAGTGFTIPDCSSME